jgi:acetyl-CoA carboxylase alpha subunit
MRGTTTFTEKWWAERSRERVHDLKEFVNGGTFIQYRPEYVFDPSLLPQDVTVTRRSGEAVSYTESLNAAREATGKDSAAEFGIIERDGIQFVVYYLDSSFRAGTLGVGEALVLKDAADLSNQKNIPLVTICSSGGAEQGQNSVALEMMNSTVANLAINKPPLHINIYKGGVYGGVPASFAGVADLQIAVESQDTRIGFTGPYPVARAQGKEPASARAQDAYTALGEEGTVHSPLRHFQSRNVHMLSEDLADASAKITHIIHVLGMKDAVKDPLPDFKPHEPIAFRETASMARQFDRPGLHFKAWLTRPFKKEFWSRSRPDTGRIYDSLKLTELSVTERIRIAQEPERPTTVDLLDTHSGIFTDVTLLGNPLHVENDSSFVEQYPSVIGALARIDGRPVMVIGHQTQLETDKQTKKRIKRYAPQKPEDWEYTDSLLDLARKQKLPVILFSDTTGADPTPGSEDRNQSHKIAKVLLKINEYPYPVISVGLGIGGSGGAKTFLRPVDAAADFENAVTVVSQPTVMYWIMTGKWIDSPVGNDTELSHFVDQLKDATAQGRLESRQIDEIIKEGQGGAHVNPALAAYGLRQWLIPQLRMLSSIPEQELLARRLGRTNRVMQKYAVKNQIPEITP